MLGGAFCGWGGRGFGGGGWEGERGGGKGRWVSAAAASPSSQPSHSLHFSALPSSSLPPSSALHSTTPPVPPFPCQPCQPPPALALYLHTYPAHTHTHSHSLRPPPPGPCGPRLHKPPHRRPGPPPSGRHHLARALAPLFLRPPAAPLASPAKRRSPTNTPLHIPFPERLTIPPSAPSAPLARGLGHERRARSSEEFEGFCRT